MDRDDRANVEAPRGLDSHHEARVGRDLARQDQALEVAAGQEASLRVDGGRGDAVRLAEPVGEAAHSARIDRPASGDRRLAVGLHDQVVGNGQVGRRPNPGPVLGHVGHVLVDGVPR